MHVRVHAQLHIQLCYPQMWKHHLQAGISCTYTRERNVYDSLLKAEKDAK